MTEKNKESLDDAFAKIFSGNGISDAELHKLQKSNNTDAEDEEDNLIDANNKKKKAEKPVVDKEEVEDNDEDDLETEEEDVDDLETKKNNKTKSDPEEKETTSYKEKYQELERRHKETKAWANKNNVVLANVKRNLSNYLNKLVDNGNLFEEDVPVAMENILANFQEENIKNNSEESTTANKHEVIKEKLDKEFSIFKKYAKIDSAEEKYTSFFYFWPMLDPKEQEQLMVYFEDEEPEKAIDQIMSIGEELYENIYLGSKEKGGILPYIKSIKTKNLKLEKKIKELEQELDNTTEKVYSKSINSRVTHSRAEQKSRDFADIWRNG